MMIWPLPEDADLPGNRRAGIPRTADDDGIDPRGADVTRDERASSHAETSDRHGIQISPEEALAFARIVRDFAADDPVRTPAVTSRRIAAFTVIGLVWMLLSVLMVALGWAGVLVTVALSAGTATVLALHVRHRGGRTCLRTTSRCSHLTASNRHTGPRPGCADDATSA